MSRNLSILRKQFDDDEFLIVDGFDEAIIGVDYTTRRVIYSVEKCLSILMAEDEMDMQDALEHLSFNVLNAYVGEMTPIFMQEIDPNVLSDTTV